MRAVVAAATLAVVAALAPAQAQAVPTSEPKVAQQDHVVLTVTAKVTHDGKTRVVGKHTDDIHVFNSSGTGGTSASSGCKTLTLTNTGKSFLFKTVLFRYITYTHWCWTRSVMTQYDHQDTWEAFKDLAATVSWEGQVNKDIGAFYWNGSNFGGYRHMRQGSYKSLSLCFNLGCENWSYPKNDARVYANGTWQYTVSGADS